MKDDHWMTYGFITVATPFWYIAGETLDALYFLIVLIAEGIVLLQWMVDRKAHQLSLLAIASVPFVGMCSAVVGYHVEPGSAPLWLGIMVLGLWIVTRAMLTFVVLSMYKTPPAAAPDAAKAEPIILEVDGRRVVYKDVTPTSPR